MSNSLHVPNAATRLGVFNVPSKSYGEFLAELWTVISQRLLLNSSETGETVSEILDAIQPWGERAIGTSCQAPSFVSEDGFPAELSLSWKGAEPELRILFESLNADPSALANQEAGRALTRRLAGRDGVSIDQYLKIEDLFVADDPQPYRPSVWHSLAWRPGEPRRYKVYLNPQAHGLDRAYEVVGEAMSRLGLSSAWQPVEARGRELAQRGHELEFFALDLGAAEASRVKIYFRHGEMPLSEMDTVASFARKHDPQRAARACRTIYGADAEYVRNEPMTCLAFRHDEAEAAEANLYLRLPDNAESDAAAHDRITELMRGEGIDPAAYTGVIAGLGECAGASLSEIVGLQELVSYRTTASDQPADVGVYLRFSTFDQPAAPRS